MAILGFDVGGSSIKFSVMTADGEILTKGKSLEDMSKLWKKD